MICLRAAAKVESVTEAVYDETAVWQGMMMVYVEAFFYYLLGVVGVFAVLFGVPLLVYLAVRLTWDDEPYSLTHTKRRLLGVVRHPLFKFAAAGYFAAFLFFYLFQSVDYYGKGRAYPRAKAYKIVADLAAFHFNTFIAHRNLYYRPVGRRFIEPYERLQRFLMAKGFAYIPEEDAERAVWRYELLLSPYVKARAAPIDFEELTDEHLRYLRRIGGFPAPYRPEAREMYERVEASLHTLLDSPMKDRRYDSVERHLATVMLAQWRDEYTCLRYALGAKSVAEEVSMAYRITCGRWSEDADYLALTRRLKERMDAIKARLENSRSLRRAAKEHRGFVPELMGLRVRLAGRLAYADMAHGKAGCDNPALLEYGRMREAFVRYAKSDKTFRRMGWRERFVADMLADGDNFLARLLIRYCGWGFERLGIDRKNYEFFKEAAWFEDETKQKGVTPKTLKILKGFNDGR